MQNYEYKVARLPPSVCKRQKQMKGPEGHVSLAII